MQSPTLSIYMAYSVHLFFKKISFMCIHLDVSAAKLGRKSFWPLRGFLMYNTKRKAPLGLRYLIQYSHELYCVHSI